MSHYTKIFSGRRKVLFLDAHGGRVQTESNGETGRYRDLMRKSVMVFEKRAHEIRWRLVKYRYAAHQFSFFYLDIFTDADIALIRMGGDARKIIQTCIQEHQETFHEEHPEWIS